MRLRRLRSDGALSVAEQHPEIALLFTDVALTGGMNGRALEDEVKRRQADLSVLYMTGCTANAATAVSIQERT